ncbi:transcriptional repressor [Paracoccus aminovorans]|uniref:transcriptional repressor n=1 Tax=Paracoccus aminovorans TaxID=34004 RepID=UPI000782FDF0|nr:transcriptional repressor [Paracoccus aminovorans]
MSGSGPSPAYTLSIESVERICAERGVRFTALRRLALEALLEFNGPVGAYDLLRALERKLGKSVGPPTAYRALEFLQEHGFVTRIETRNAFVPSSHPDDPGVGAFFLCNHCGATFEVDLPGLEAEFARRAETFGFRVGRRVVELQGICADCQHTAAAVEGQGQAAKAMTTKGSRG